MPCCSVCTSDQPHTCPGVVRSGNAFQDIADGRSHANLIPHFRLASMDVDVRSRPQLITQTSMHSADTIRQRGCVGVDVIKKANRCSPSLNWAPTASGDECCPTENKCGMRSPCSPPALRDGVEGARCTLPEVLRGCPAEHAHGRQN